MTLIFSVAEFADELRALAGIAGPFLAPNYREVIASLDGQIATVRDAGGPVRLRIDETMPLRTRISVGGYERGNGGAHEVLAQFTCAWDVRPLGERRRRAPDRAFRIDGIASTVISIFHLVEGFERPVGSWRLEVAHDADASEPGAYLHMQHGGPQEGLGSIALPVPRIPIGLYTPMLAVEFAIAELFQEEWLSAAAAGSQDFATWRRIQLARAEAVANWLLNDIRDREEGTPLLRQKKAKPKPGLLVEGRFRPVELREVARR